MTTFFESDFVFGIGYIPLLGFLMLELTCQVCPFFIRLDSRHSFSFYFFICSYCYRRRHTCVLCNSQSVEFKFMCMLSSVGHHVLVWLSLDSCCHCTVLDVVVYRHVYFLCRLPLRPRPSIKCTPRDTLIFSTFSFIITRNIYYFI
jgi:hypothetical protein